MSGIRTQVFFKTSDGEVYLLKGTNEFNASVFKILDRSYKSCWGCSQKYSWIELVFLLFVCC